MLWSLLGQFWKIFIKIKQLKILMPVSLTSKNQEPLKFQKALMNTWYLQNFILIQRAAQKILFALFRNIFYETNMTYIWKL